MLHGIDAVPAVAAAEVQDTFSGEIRQEPLQGFPFARAFQPLLGTAHLAVFFEKDRVVVFVLFHRFLLLKEMEKW